MVWLIKCLGPDIRKIRTKKRRPNRATGPDVAIEIPAAGDELKVVDLLADIGVSLFL
jgi:hypothetical protein